MSYALVCACTPAPLMATTAETSLDPSGLTTSTGLDTSSTTTVAPTTGGPAPAYECGDLPSDPIELALAGETTCARRGCALQCWGRSRSQLGHTRVDEGACLECESADCCLGDNEAPAAWGDVDVGEPIVQVATSGRHTCVLLDDGRVRCWGANEYGQLGLAHPIATPPGSPPAARPDAKLGGPAVAVAAGSTHTCALMDGGAVRCWGSGAHGRLGLGSVETIGDDELPQAVAAIDLGAPAVAVAVAENHVCALLVGGALRCWGSNRHGQLGLGHLEDIGDDEAPASVDPIDVGAAVVQVAVAGERTCVVTVDGGVRCWGWDPTRGPGIGIWCDCDEDPLCCVGDDEVPAAHGDIDLGARALHVSLNYLHTCALLEDGEVVCWGPTGDDGTGIVGPADDACYACDDAPSCCIGDDEPPAAAPRLPLPAPAAQLVLSESHACVVDVDDAIRCWGRNTAGELGVANTPASCERNCNNGPDCCLGDDESIAGAEAVHAFSP